MDQNTHFASPERSPREEIERDGRLLAEESSLLDLLGSVSGIAALLNENRQIIYANESFLEMIGLKSLDQILGNKPGEAVGCIHSEDMPSGCGTSEACSFCGAVNAIIESQLTGKKSVRETRVTSEIVGKLKSWDMKITSSPVVIRNRKFYVFTIQDISDEKRRQNLERIFFHDILNTAGSLNGLLTILKDGADPEEERELIDLSEEASRELMEEIILHRQIRAAENGDLIVKFEKINSVEVLKAAFGKIGRHEVAKEKRIIIVDHSSDTEIETDRILLQRILMNMLKNALEATEAGGTVFAEAEDLSSVVRYRVKNDSVMTREVQFQIFQRSFTTKGKGRGIGTYSIKLLTENYLRGKAGFSSTESDGTLFWVDIPKIIKSQI
jgi:signal transduction histidine kinase